MPQRQRTSDAGTRDPDRSLYGRRATAAAAKATALKKQETREALNAAVRSFQESIQFFKSARSYNDAADNDIQLGEVFFTLGRYKDALNSYGEVLSLAGDDKELRCRALSHIAIVYENQGKSAEAADYSQQALHLADGLFPKTRAEALEARGRVLQYSDSTKAEELFVSARTLFADAKDTQGEVRVLLSLASLRFSVRSSTEAASLATQALRLSRSDNSSRGVAEARLALGGFDAANDRFEAAECNLKDAQALFRTLGDEDNEAIALNWMGHVSREKGDFEASLRNYQRARELLDGMGDNLGEGETLTGMAKTFTEMQQTRKTIPLYKDKFRLAQRTQNPSQIAASLAGMAMIYELKNDFAQAEIFYRRSLETYRSQKRAHGVIDALLRLALLRERQNRHAEAIEFLESALPFKNDRDYPEDAARIEYELAYNYRRLNRLEEARSAIEEAVRIIENQRLLISNYDSRASYFASVHRYYALYIQVLMLLDRRTPGQGLASLAFETAEKSKVRALLDLLQASAPVSPCNQLLSEQLSDSAVLAAKTAPPVSASPLTLQQIQAEIVSDDTVLLEFALGDERSYLWVVDRKQIVAHELPSEDRIRRLSQAFRNNLTARQPLPNERLEPYDKRVQAADRLYPTLARRLWHMLLAPASLGHAKRLLIVPDGVLQNLPFSAFLAARGGKDSAAARDREIVDLPSASTLSVLRRARAKRAPPKRTAAVLADPVFEMDDPRVTRTPHSAVEKAPARSRSLQIALRDIQKSQYISSLPGTRVEALAIQRSLGQVRVLTALDFDANKNFVIEGELRDYRFIHLAVHGLMDDIHPEMSGLVLSLIDRKGRRQDGYLRIGDIDKLELSADLVVLSACDSALGRDMRSEGIIGLPRAFLHAGAGGVIAGLWKVDDEATAEFMKGLYARLQAGDNPGAALRHAQNEMSHSARWSAPFYWAAFVLLGDYK